MKTRFTNNLDTTETSGHVLNSVVCRTIPTIHTRMLNNEKIVIYH